VCACTPGRRCLPKGALVEFELILSAHLFIPIQLTNSFDFLFPLLRIGGFRSNDVQRLTVLEEGKHIDRHESFSV